MSRSTSTWPGLAQAINRMIKSGAWASLSDAGRAVWLPLAKRANRGGRCWPSVNTIAREAGKGRTQTYSAVDELETVGLIRRESSPGGAPTCTTTYIMQPIRPAEPVRPTERVSQTAPVRQTEPLPVRPAGQTRPAHRTRITKESRSKSPKRRKRRDEVFEALAEVCGLALDALTKSARGQLNKATKDLREVEAEPWEIRQRAEVYRQTYQRAKLTPSALAKHWPQLAGSDTTDGGLTTGWVEPTDEELAAVLGEGGDA